MWIAQEVVLKGAIAKESSNNTMVLFGQKAEVYGKGSAHPSLLPYDKEAVRNMGGQAGAKNGEKALNIVF